MFGLTPRSRRARRSRNFTLRRSTPVMQCSVGRAREGEQREPLDSVSDSGFNSSGSYHSFASSQFAGAASLTFSNLSSTATSFVNDFFQAFKTMGEEARDRTEGTGIDINIKPVHFLISLIVMVGLSTVMTLIFATSGVTKGYVLRELQSESQVLVRQNETVTTEVARAQSMNSVVNNDVLLRMRPAKNIIFMAGSSAIASK